jgi:hypothetical protein
MRANVPKKQCAQNHAYGAEQNQVDHEGAQTTPEAGNLPTRPIFLAQWSMYFPLKSGLLQQESPGGEVRRDKRADPG